MPLYDRACDNDHKMIDCWEPMEMGEVLCTECQAPTRRVWLGKANSVIGDDIPGGVWIRHGLCNEDGTPRKYYSHSEIRKEAERRGLTNAVRHVTNPNTGSDKNKYTTRWV